VDLQKLYKVKLDRRRLLSNLGMMGAGAALVACGPRIQALPPAEACEVPPVVNPTPAPGITPTQQPNVDLAIGNFALNLEYLEAEYYLRGVFGRSLADSDIGMNPGDVIGGRQVNFMGQRNFQNAEEIALDEEAHVKFLRAALGDGAIDRPTINFTDAFDAAGQAAGLGAGFDPFANEVNFILGAFIFEDVGVTAYNGAVPFVTDRGVLGAAASIALVEGYHAGDIRNVIFNRGGAILEAANAISAARAALGGGKDQAVVHDNPFGTRANITPTDENGLAFARTPFEVLNIVYLDLSLTATPGGFFPDGVNGEFGELLELTT
jgi:hypothetical protein